MLGKTEAGREFQFLEVIGTIVLANEVVRLFSNLTAKECWESCLGVLSPFVSEGDTFRGLLLCAMVHYHEAKSLLIESFDILVVFVGGVQY